MQNAKRIIPKKPDAKALRELQLNAERATEELKASHSALLSQEKDDDNNESKWSQNGNEGDEADTEESDDDVNKDDIPPNTELKFDFPDQLPVTTVANSAKFKPVTGEVRSTSPSTQEEGEAKDGASQPPNNGLEGKIDDKKESRSLLEEVDNMSESQITELQSKLQEKVRARKSEQLNQMLVTAKEECQAKFTAVAAGLQGAIKARDDLQEIQKLNAQKLDFAKENARSSRQMVRNDINAIEIKLREIQNAAKTVPNDDDVSGNRKAIDDLIRQVKLNLKKAKQAATDNGFWIEVSNDKALEATKEAKPPAPESYAQVATKSARSVNNDKKKTQSESKKAPALQKKHNGHGGDQEDQVFEEDDFNQPEDQESHTPYLDNEWSDDGFSSVMSKRRKRESPMPTASGKISQYPLSDSSADEHDQEEWESHRRRCVDKYLCTYAANCQHAHTKREQALFKTGEHDMYRLNSKEGVLLGAQMCAKLRNIRIQIRKNPKYPKQKYVYVPRHDQDQQSKFICTNNSRGARGGRGRGRTRGRGFNKPSPGY